LKLCTLQAHIISYFTVVYLLLLEITTSLVDATNLSFFVVVDIISSSVLCTRWRSTIMCLNLRPQRSCFAMHVWFVFKSAFMN